MKTVIEVPTITLELEGDQIDMMKSVLMQMIERFERIDKQVYANQCKKLLSIIKEKDQHTDIQPVADTYHQRLRNSFGNQINFDTDVMEVSTLDSSRLFMIYIEAKNSVTVMRLTKDDTLCETITAKQELFEPCTDRETYLLTVGMLRTAMGATA